MLRRNRHKKYDADDYANRTRIVFALLSVVIVVFLIDFYQDTDFSKSRNDFAGLVSHQLYTGYAVPINSIIVNTTLVFNNASEVKYRTFDIFDSIVYRRGYVSYDGQDWTPFNLTSVDAPIAEWFYDKGSVNISFTPSRLRINGSRIVTNDTYIVVYTCSKNTSIRNWSCHDGWQIIKFDARFNASTVCSNECTQNGLTQCSGTTGYQTCGNYDQDICLEWNAVTLCLNNQICTNNVCVAKTDVISWTPELMINGGFEDGNMNGWTTSDSSWVSGSHVTNTQYVMPKSGTKCAYYAGSSSIDNYIYQDIDLKNYIAYIDFGKAVVNASGWGVSSESTAGPDRTRIQIFFLNSVKTVIGTAVLDTGYKAQSTVGDWWNANISNSVIPAKTRYIRMWGNTYEECPCDAGSLDAFSVRVGLNGTPIVCNGPITESCYIENGVGTRTFNCVSGTPVPGSCNYGSCDDGYEWDGSSCVEIGYSTTIAFESPTPNDGATVTSSAQRIVASVSSDSTAVSSFVDFDNSLMLWLRFEDNAIDSSSHGWYTVDNGVMYDSGMFGNSANGFTETQDITVDSALDYASTDMTISFWLNVNDYTYPDRQNPFGKAFGGDGTLTMETSGTMNFYFGSSGEDAAPYASPSSSVTVVPQTWENWIIVRDIDAHTVQWFKNGVAASEVIDYSIATDSDAAIDVIVHSDMSLQIGDDYTNPLNGKIDEFMIFNRVLSESEIAALYDSMNNNLDASFTGLSSGQHTYTVYAIDGYGNMIESAKRSFTVPAAGCTPDCSANQCSGSTGYYVCSNTDSDSCLELSSSVTACADIICREPTCTGSGVCGSTFVASGSTDESCTGSTGCTGGSCKCNGAGSCTSQPPVVSTKIIIDHTTTDVTKIPPTCIAKAKRDLRIAYSHASHGAQLVAGMEALADYSSTYDLMTGRTWAESSWSTSKLYMREYQGWGGSDMFPGSYQASDISHTIDIWADLTRDYLDGYSSEGSKGTNINVMMWSWCGTSNANIGSIDASDVQSYYLNELRSMMNDYDGSPKRSVKFVAMTIHSPPSFSGSQNKAIRDWCAANADCILFDFADIEEYSPSGTSYVSRDVGASLRYNCAAGSGRYDCNWATDYLGSSSASSLNVQLTNILKQQFNSNNAICQHSPEVDQVTYSTIAPGESSNSVLNCALKGQASWYLWARLAGWDGDPTHPCS